MLMMMMIMLVMIIIMMMFVKYVRLSHTNECYFLMAIRPTMMNYADGDIYYITTRMSMKLVIPGLSRYQNQIA